MRRRAASRSRRHSLPWLWQPKGTVTTGDPQVTTGTGPSYDSLAMETFVAPAVRPRPRVGTLAVLGALSSFGSLSMDMYLPSSPTIAANLHASQSLVQLTLSGCLAGLAV